MKVYQCDSCKRTIIDPYREKMKEFYLESNYDCGMCFPVKRRRKIKIHLCANCYEGLHIIAKNKI